MKAKRKKYFKKRIKTFKIKFNTGEEIEYINDLVHYAPYNRFKVKRSKQSSIVANILRISDTNKMFWHVWKIYCTQYTKHITELQLNKF